MFFRGERAVKRRELIRAAVSAGVLKFVPAQNDRVANPGREVARSRTESKLPEAPGLTRYVAEFVLQLQLESIPAEVLALGKKSVLDGFGLALAGSASEMAAICRKYLQCTGAARGSCTVIGSRLKTTPRFA